MDHRSLGVVVVRACKPFKHPCGFGHARKADVRNVHSWKERGRKTRMTMRLHGRSVTYAEKKSIT